MGSRSQWVPTVFATMWIDCASRQVGMRRVDFRHPGLLIHRLTMNEYSRTSKAVWSDVKARLADVDREGLLKLIQDLYAASKDNQSFLHARFGLGDDVLKPYKATIDRWLWPDAFKNQDISIAKAKKAISDYKKAVGQPDGLAELMVFFCERGAGFSRDVGFGDEDFFAALLRMFEQALLVAATLPEPRRSQMADRLDAVRETSRGVGYGLSDGMDDLLLRRG